MSPEVVLSLPPQAEELGIDAGHRHFIAALLEGLAFPTGGELVVRSDAATARVFLAAGRIAWVTVSTQKATLSDVLIAEHGVAAQELRAVYEECKNSGGNFAETLVSWGVVDRECLLTVLRHQIARALLEICSWSDERVLVMPSNRTYQSSMTFTPAELVAAVEQEATPEQLPAVRRMAVLFAAVPAPQPPPATTPAPATPVRPPPPHDVVRVPKEKQMALENYLTELKDVKGYKAAGIMHYTGEMLASDWTGSEVDVNLVGATFNDIFRSSHEACQKIGLDACTESVINTPKGQVIMRCSGVQAKAHFHMLCVLTADGNQALAKMRMEKMVPKVMAELA